MSFATGVEPCWKKEYSPTPAALGGCISEVWPRKEPGGHPVTNWTVPLQPPDQFPAPTTAHCTTATRTMFGCRSQPPWASTLRLLVWLTGPRDLSWPSSGRLPPLSPPPGLLSVPQVPPSSFQPQDLYLCSILCLEHHSLRSCFSRLSSNNYLFV